MTPHSATHCAVISLGLQKIGVFSKKSTAECTGPGRCLRCCSVGVAPLPEYGKICSRRFQIESPITIKMKHQLQSSSSMFVIPT